MGVVAAEERLARVAALSSDLDPVGTGGELGDGGHFRVRLMCAMSRRRGANSGILGRIPA